MRKLLTITTLAIVMVSTAGCVSPLDRAQSRVRQEFHNVADIFAVATTVYTKGANEMAYKKHDLQGQLIVDRWGASLDANTNAAGMVSADWLVQALPLRDKALATKRDSERSWRNFSGSYLTALEKFKATNTMLGSQEADIMEQKESAHETLMLTIQALGAVAAGAALIGG